MKASLWKLTALAGVVGAGFLVVYQAQTNLSQRATAAQTSGSEEQFLPPDEQPSGASDGPAPKSEAPRGFSFLDSPSEPTQVEPPPRQSPEPTLANQSEPTPAFASEPAQVASNPFSRRPGARPSELNGSPADDDESAQDRFAELVSSLTAPAPNPGDEEASSGNPFAPRVQPFSGAAHDTEYGDTEHHAVQNSGPSGVGVTPADSGNPFAAESDSLPAPGRGPAFNQAPAFAQGPAFDQGPAIDQRPAPGQRPISAPEETGPGIPSFAGHASDTSQPGAAGATSSNPFATDPTPLRPVDPDNPPLLIPPPIDATVDAAGANQPAPSPFDNADEPPDAARTAGNDLVFPAPDDGPRISLSSQEQAADGSDSAASLVLPQFGDSPANPQRTGVDSARTPWPEHSGTQQPPSGSSSASPGRYASVLPTAAPRDNGGGGPDGAVEMIIQPRTRDHAGSPHETPPRSAPPQEPNPFAVMPDASQTSPPANTGFATPPAPGFGTANNPFEPAGDAAAPPGGPAGEPAPLPAPLEPSPYLPRDIQPPLQRDIQPSLHTSPSRERLNPQNLLGVGTVPSNSPLGTQQAQLTIEKEAPADAVIGEPLIYSIHVTNIGRSVAENVVVRDLTPQGSRLVGTVPQAELDEASGQLIWRLGKIDAGDVRTIKVKVVPTQAGPIGSVATVSFEAAVAARIVITAPELQLTMQGPDEVSVGEQVPFRFTASNVGSADAHGVYIRNLIPQGFEHPGGNDLEYEIGVLAKGQSKDVNLTLRAVAPGQFENHAILGADGDLAVEASRPVTVLTSRLTIHRQGPANRFVGRAARFTNTITNQSSKPLSDVTVVETVPAGVQFEAASDGGRFDPQTRTVTWRLPQLEPGGQRQLQTVLIPAEVGERLSTVTASNPQGNEVQTQSRLLVAGFSSLKIDVAHDGAPVPIGEEVALRLSIKNRGTAPASQVKTLIEVPPQMRFVNAKGPVQYRLVGDNLVEFETVSTLPIDAEQQFDIVLTAAEKGDARVRVELQAAELSSPLNEEELVVIHPVQE